MEASTTERINSLKQLLETSSLKSASRMLNALHPAEIADLLESLPLQKRRWVWDMVDPEIDGEVLVELGEEVRNSLLQDMDNAELIAAMEQLDVDDMADLILSLPEDVIRETVTSMDKQRLQQVEAILCYPEDTAGGLMDLNAITVRPDVTLEVVLRYLRRLGELPDNTNQLMVVDRYNNYLGTITLGQILTCPSESLVADLLHRTAAVAVDMTAKEVARLFQDRDLISAPVVDAANKLVGRITIDDVVDVIVEGADKSVMNMGGLKEYEDVFAPIVKSTQRRALWLGANLLTALLAAWVIGWFEATIQQIVALAILMPIVASMGGIAGSQTLTLIIRSQALGQIGKGNIRSIMTKELAIGALNGLLWSLVVAIITAFWFHDWGLGGVIAVALLANLICAGFMGVFIPLMLLRMKIDPALAGSVILTTATDVVGFATFLGVATLLLL